MATYLDINPLGNSETSHLEITVRGGIYGSLDLKGLFTGADLPRLRALYGCDEPDQKVRRPARRRVA